MLYGATKAALDSVTETMALELGKYNVRVNAVNPTVVLTDMGRLNWSDPAVAGPALKRIPLGRFAGTYVLLFNESRNKFKIILRFCLE